MASQPSQNTDGTTQQGQPPTAPGLGDFKFEITNFNPDVCDTCSLLQTHGPERRLNHTLTSHRRIPSVCVCRLAASKEKEKER